MSQEKKVFAEEFYINIQMYYREEGMAFYQNRFPRSLNMALFILDV